jgi:hypothetical protein
MKVKTMENIKRGSLIVDEIGNKGVVVKIERGFDD